jgi:hypothetical protein
LVFGFLTQDFNDGLTHQMWGRFNIEALSFLFDHGNHFTDAGVEPGGSFSSVFTMKQLSWVDAIEVRDFEQSLCADSIGLVL